MGRAFVGSGGPGSEDQQQDTNRLRQRADEADRRASRAAREDLIVEMPRRLFMRSPNGTYWQVSVDDTGKLVTTNVGDRL